MSWALCLIVLACAPKQPELSEPPAPAEPPVCRLGPGQGWPDVDVASCSIPWSGAGRHGDGVPVFELRSARLADPGLAVGIRSSTSPAEGPPVVELPWALGPDGRGSLAGDIRVLDGPDGELSCPGPAPTHAVRLELHGTELELMAMLGERCEDPPVYEGDNALVWERPLPGGGVQEEGPVDVYVYSGRGPRPPVISEACTGMLFELDELRAQDLCRVDYSSAGSFPPADELVLEAPEVRGRSGERLRFDVDWVNQTDSVLVVDLRLSDGMDLGAWELHKDGVPVEVPSGCDMSSLAMGEGRQVALEPGGRLRTPVSTVLQPGGEGLYRQAGPQCDVRLKPGSYELMVQAPERNGGREVAVPVTVLR